MGGAPASVGLVKTIGTKAPTKSIRFFHKFDPVPSALLYKNSWEHKTEEALLLFDMPMSACYNPETPSCAMTTGAPYNTRSYVPWSFRWETNMGVDSLHNFLCDSYDVKASGYLLSGKKSETYFSYMNMFNPMPCAEVLVSNVYESLKTNGIQLAPMNAPFVPLENFAECTETYLGTVKAYYKTYLASDLEGFRGSKDWEEDWLEHTTFVLAWGLMYVHMTYPNYPLCATKGYGDYTYMGGKGFDKDPVETFTDKLQAHLPGWTPGTGSGDGKYGFGEYDWESKNQPTYQAMYGDLADFWETQMP